jgi:hypothetical protein
MNKENAKITMDIADDIKSISKIPEFQEYMEKEIEILEEKDRIMEAVVKAYDAGDMTTALMHMKLFAELDCWGEYGDGWNDDDIACMVFYHACNNDLLDKVKRMLENDMRKISRDNLEQTIETALDGTNIDIAEYCEQEGKPIPEWVNPKYELAKILREFAEKNNIEI